MSWQFAPVPARATFSAVLTYRLTYFFTLRTAFFVTLPSEAEIVAFAVDFTCPDCTVKVAELAPAATRMLTGTEATEALLLERLICTPPAGAAPLSVTVPCVEAADLTVVGSRLSDDKDGPDGGWSVSTADTIAPE
jgi:hypothetical protein